MNFSSGNVYKVIIYNIGHRVVWTKYGRFHRDKGPAEFFCSTGYQVYYKEGKIHRLNGPAAIMPNRYQAWGEEGYIIKQEGSFI
jgi:hypothetical protein